MTDDLFSRQEEASGLLGIAQAFYTSHIHAGRPYLGLQDAIRMAAMLFGLAQSDAAHALVVEARANAVDSLETLASLAREAAKRIGAEQEARVALVAAAIAPRGSETAVLTSADKTGLNPRSAGSRPTEAVSEKWSPAGSESKIE